LNWKFGHAWVREHHFANKGKLPTYVRKRGAASPVATTLMRRKR
jgi:hypothetical protein